MFDLKKFLLIILSFTFLLFPSCERDVNKRSVAVNRPNGKVTVEYNSSEYTAQIQYSDTGVMIANMLSPLENMTLTVGYDGCEIAYDGMTVEYSAEQTESFCPFIELYSLLKTVCYTEPESARLDGENYSLKFNDGVNICKAIAATDGTLREIEADGMKFEFT